MPKKGKKHEILGGIKVSSQQLSEWGKTGGRPQKWKNSAERARAFRLRKKQEKFGVGVELRGYKSYGETQIKKVSITCPNCGKTEQDLRKYFNEKGEFIKETWWFDTVKWERKNVRENRFFCSNCCWGFDFKKIKVKEVKEVRKRREVVKKGDGNGERKEKKKHSLNTKSENASTIEKLFLTFKVMVILNVKSAVNVYKNKKSPCGAF